MSRLHLDLELRRGDFSLRTAVASDGPWIGVVGPSGAGKSSLLEAVAGLIPMRGRIEVEGRVLDDSTEGAHLPARRRRVGLVFQGEALFPHMTAAENLVFGISGAPSDRRDRAFAEVTEVLDLEDLLERRPAALSGGEKRRVALGRALLSDPALLLLDEPLTGLDTALRRRILDYLVRVKQHFLPPALMVSHQLEDVLALADHVVVLEAGRVQDQGAPPELLRQTDRSVLAHLVGFENVLTGTLQQSDPISGTARVLLDGGLQLRAPFLDLPEGSRVRIGVRAEDLILASQRPGPTSARNLLRVSVDEVVPRGPWTLVDLDCGGSLRLTAKVTPASVRELELRTGRDVWVLFKTHSIHYLE
ncbi:MAG: molybdenum ABC transporter ATP-binding protein [bacterium]